MERRKFFRNFTIGGSLLLTAPMLFNACSSDDDNTDGNNNGNQGGVTIDLNDPNYAKLKTVGGFEYKDNMIVIRSTDTVYIALSKLCTHDACTVTYNASQKQLPCPCHGSKFTDAGAVINGPASSPLKKYNVTVQGNILTIS